MNVYQYRTSNKMHTLVKNNVKIVQKSYIRLKPILENYFIHSLTRYRSTTPFTQDNPA